MKILDELGVATLWEKIKNYVSRKVFNPDDEDLVAEETTGGTSVIKLADRSYSPQNFSGKGYKILRKNIKPVTLAVTKIVVSSVPTSDGYISFIINGVESHVDVVASSDTATDKVAEKIAAKLSETMTEYEVSKDASTITLTRKFGGKISQASSFSAVSTGASCSITDSTKTELRNILTPIMMNQPNTIYEIRYDFDLNGETIGMQDGCTLKFEGGSFGNGILKGNNTVIKSQPIQIFRHLLPYNCISETYAYPEWFGCSKNGKNDSTEALSNAIYFFKTVLLSGTYLVTDTLKYDVNSGYNILGKNGATINYVPSTYNKPIIYVYKKSGTGISSINNFYINNVTFKMTSDNIGGLVFGCTQLSNPNFYPEGFNYTEFDDVTDSASQEYVTNVNFENCTFIGKADSNQVLLTRIKCIDSNIKNCIFRFGKIGVLDYGCDNPIITQSKFEALDYGNWAIGSGSFAVLYSYYNNIYNQINYIPFYCKSVEITFTNNRIEARTALSQNKGLLHFKDNYIEFDEGNIQNNASIIILEVKNDIYGTFWIIANKNGERYTISEHTVKVPSEIIFEFTECVNGGVVIDYSLNANISGNSIDTVNTPPILVNPNINSEHYIMITNNFCGYNYSLNKNVAINGNMKTNLTEKVKALNNNFNTINPRIYNGSLTEKIVYNRMNCFLEANNKVLFDNSYPYRIIKLPFPYEDKTVVAGVNYAYFDVSNLYFSSNEEKDKQLKITVLLYNPNKVKSYIQINGYTCKDADIVFTRFGGSNLKGNAFERIIAYTKSNFLIKNIGNSIFIRNEDKNKTVYPYQVIIELVNEEVAITGSTSNRPTLTLADEGFEYYDSTLKKKILWNGTAWVNMDGTEL